MYCINAINDEYLYFYLKKTKDMQWKISYGKALTQLFLHLT